MKHYHIPSSCMVITVHVVKVVNIVHAHIHAPIAEIWCLDASITEMNLTA